MDTVSLPETASFAFLEKNAIPFRFEYIEQLCQAELVRSLRLLGLSPALVEVTSFSEIKNVRGGPPAFFRTSTIYNQRGRQFVVREILTQKVTLFYHQVRIQTSSLGNSYKKR